MDDREAKNKLRLTLDRRGDGAGRRSGSTTPLLVVAIVLVAADLFLALRGRGADPAGLPAADARDLALQLEERGLLAAAGNAWTEYLAVARPGREASGKVWYRIGKLRQEEGDWEGALDAFYRSEAHARLPELETEIGRRSAECLEQLGRFAALRRELEERTAATPADSAAGGRIVAEIGDWKIRRADLDRLIEAEIETQLEAMAGELPAEARRTQKERMLEAAVDGGRAAWLERFIAEELLYRRAREEGIADEPAVAALRRNLERKLLAGRLLERSFETIEIGPEELRRWYDAHAEELAGDDGVTPAFDAARERVLAAVRAEMEAAIARETVGELMRRYGAVIHREALEEP